MILLKEFSYQHCAILFLFLLPSALTVPYYDSDDSDGEFLQLSDTTLWEESDKSIVVRRAVEPSSSSKWPVWHPARRHMRSLPTDTRKRYLPYHPVVRFRSPKPDFMEYPVLSDTRRYEDQFNKDLSVGEFLALLSNVMVHGASQGRLKGLRFGISK